MLNSYLGLEKMVEELEGRITQGQKELFEARSSENKIRFQLSDCMVENEYLQSESKKKDLDLRYLRSQVEFMETEKSSLVLQLNSLSSKAVVSSTDVTQEMKSAIMEEQGKSNALRIQVLRLEQELEVLRSQQPRSVSVEAVCQTSNPEMLAPSDTEIAAIKDAENSKIYASKLVVELSLSESKLVELQKNFNALSAKNDEITMNYNSLRMRLESAVATPSLAESSIGHEAFEEARALEVRIYVCYFLSPI